MKLFNVFISVVILVSFSSCAIYKSNMQNVPMFKEKNELRATISKENFQTAYSFSDRFAVMANGQFARFDEENVTYFPNSPNEITYDYDFKQTFGELGLGYFKNLYEYDIFNLSFEVYGGAGIGRSTIDISNDRNGGQNGGQMSVNFSRYFFQPSLTVVSHKVVDFSFSARYLGLKFTNAVNPLSIDEIHRTPLRGIERPFFHLLEPAVTLKVGYKFIKAYFQLGTSLVLNNGGYLVTETIQVDRNTSETRKYKGGVLIHYPVLLGFGLSINIDKRYSEK